jgi:hypothetical protein
MRTVDARRDFTTMRERARPELLWYLRHEQALGRWPVIDEPWARRVERRRSAESAAPDSAHLPGADR